MLARIGLAGLVTAAVIGTAWLVLPEAFPQLGPWSGAEVRPAMATLATAAVPAGIAQPPAEPPAAIPPPEPPRFHIARVSGRGMLVTAGSALPGAEVTLLEGARELGRARADARGEWVILPGDPLPPGPKELVLVARSPGGNPLHARDTLLLMVPAPSAAGARPEAAGATALLLPPTAAGGAAPRPLEAPPAPAGGRQRLGLDVVDYDDAGAMRFAGSAPTGATVRVYVGRNHAGDAVADQAGRWALSPATQPGVGRHTLRVDQLTAAGKVAARIELPFQRERLPDESAIAADGRLVVQPGANLWRIARKVYGQGTRYTVIYQANREQIRDPNRIYPGQLFSLPTGPAETDSSRSR
ncbi:LysM peptidoglycan-binding domain-containing protein [Roseicella aquatilis]|uniref:LysM peptidoglycan-binding domain-containing protein n=1 Tax=Roseicella aquatilis TaxID=2527868 RepID=A0A4R4DXU2_9PROT|nr:LysM peptidoglycan-binding domain-containing protein [Roseicella aquatilis]TCZ65928.1 LysM peptidoglycan-binding domain-containing protein [Roseicella aquatilis]